MRGCEHVYKRVIMSVFKYVCESVTAFEIMCACELVNMCVSVCSFVRECDIMSVSA